MLKKTADTQSLWFAIVTAGSAARHRKKFKQGCAGRPLLQSVFAATLFGCIGLVSSASQAETITVSSSASIKVKGHIKNLQSQRAANRSGQHRYIVQLQAPALVRHMSNISAGQASYSPIMPEAGLPLLSMSKSNSGLVYKGMLEAKQQSVVGQAQQMLGRPLQVSHRYTNSFNGFAADLSAEDAERLRALPDVKKVIPDRARQLLSDVGPQWIGAPSLWQSPTTEWFGSMGEGQVVAVIDSGINSQHPSFADIGDDGFDHQNPLGSGNYLPGSYCDQEDPTFCNDKLIGAWRIVSNEGDAGAPEDSVGHGSHVASIAAGNVVESATLSNASFPLQRDISGVAPHANIIAYDACFTDCLTSDLLAAVEQVLEDASALPNGIQALNYSISSQGNPYDDPISQAFLNLTAAGIYVSVAAGNSGPEPATLEPTAPWVATVGATTHPRKLVSNALVDITAVDGEQVADIESSIISGAYPSSPLVYAGDYPNESVDNPETCIFFPENTFNGDIVVCLATFLPAWMYDQVNNVKAAGGGAVVLILPEVPNYFPRADEPFSLPTVALNYESGQALLALLAEQQVVAAIRGSRLQERTADADKPAWFSGRGPFTEFDVLKPDIMAPGVDIFGAFSPMLPPVVSAPLSREYGILSGTSMAAPHHTGAALLMKAQRPDLSPYEIKSALMMNARRGQARHRQSDEPTPFDVGAGRTELSEILRSSLVLNETPENFRAANPSLGGKPESLNLASMQKSYCVEACDWVRRIKNSGDTPQRYQFQVQGPKDIDFTVSPKQLSLQPGEEADITLQANTLFAEPGWRFASLNIESGSRAKRGAKLHLPIAVKAADTNAPGLFNFNVNRKEATAGDTLSFDLQLKNEQNASEQVVQVELPERLNMLKYSLHESLDGGTRQALSVRNGRLEWRGKLDTASIALEPGQAPGGYFPLASVTEEFGCPIPLTFWGACNAPGVILEVPTFTYMGEQYSEVIWSVNGVIEVGTRSHRAAFSPDETLPSPDFLNNLLAPFWTNMELRSGASWYTAVVETGGQEYVVFEWHNMVAASFFEDVRHTFQVWIQTGDTENIFFVYENMGENPPDLPLLVGAEDAEGLVGDTYYFNGEGNVPRSGDQLHVRSVPGGSVQLSFDARVKPCRRHHSPLVARAALQGNLDAKAIATVECQPKRGKH